MSQLPFNEIYMKFYEAMTLLSKKIKKIILSILPIPRGLLCLVITWLASREDIIKTIMKKKKIPLYVCGTSLLI